MRFKRLLALLLAAALALSLLAGCGGGKNQSLAQIILNLLDDQYTNVTVEIDPDLEADLRKAVSGAETEEEIRAALEEILGPGINFRLLGDGQKGDTAWNLILYPGNDPDAAGRSAFAEWNKVFAFLPKDGQYGTKIAMIETENGYALLVQATVDRAGSRDDDDDEPDEPEKPKEPYEVTSIDASGKATAVTVGTSEGLSQILSGTAAGGSEEEKKALTQAYNDGFEDVTIKLEPNTTYTVSDTFTITFKGILKGESESNKATINITDGDGLFAQIGVEGGPDNNGRVENITFDVQTTITNTYESGTYTVVYAGAVAGLNYGEITNCDVKLNNSTIKIEEVVGQHRAGGIVGQNSGTITGCTVTGGTIQVEGQLAFAGGIAGYNSLNGTTGGEITDCTVTGAIIKADGGGGAMAGGLVGYNNDGKITGSCEAKDTRVTAQTDSMGAIAGGLVGRNNSCIVTGTYTYTGSGTLTAITGWDRLGKYYKYSATVFVPNSENSYTNTVGDGETDMAYAGTGIGCDFTSDPQGPQPADNHKNISP